LNARQRFEVSTSRYVFGGDAGRLCLLPDEERFSSLVIDREAKMFRVPTAGGAFHMLPEARGAGYGSGYSRGGPTELSLWIEKIVRSQGT
jgi:hypothetical protein